MARSKQIQLSLQGQQALMDYGTHLLTVEDLARKTVDNYLSDLRQFAAWCESTWQEGGEAAEPFAPAIITTPTITQYRAYLQTVLQLRPATINRALVSLKRYCAWAMHHGLIQRDPAKVVKLVPEEDQLPRHLTDQEESALLVDVSLHDLRHRFGYRMAASVPLHRLAQIMGHDSLDTTMIYIRGTRQDLQREVEKIAWQ